MKSKSWLALFIIDAILDLLFVFFKKDELRYFTKPLLIILLFAYCIAAIKKKDKLFFLLLTALFFSFLGDIFLMFEKQASYWFMVGLIGFLLAHIFYIILFLQIKKQNQPKKKLNFLIALLTIAYTTFLFLLLKPSLGSLEIPVLVYAIVLSCMFLASFHAFDFSGQQFGRLCIIGALLFVASDSLLAINKFYQSFAGSGILVMLTYALAQLLIVLSITKYINLKSENFNFT
ncbi:MAG TPA: lysoplasmalogenase [Puia sp.]|nr:lysoplasmalogenase [Puia sp.]